MIEKIIGKGGGGCPRLLRACIFFAQPSIKFESDYLFVKKLWLLYRDTYMMINFKKDFPKYLARFVKEEEFNSLEYCVRN